MVHCKMRGSALGACKLNHCSVKFKNTKPEEKKEIYKNKMLKQAGYRLSHVSSFPAVFVTPLLPLMYCNLHLGFICYFPLHFEL